MYFIFEDQISKLSKKFSKLKQLAKQLFINRPSMSNTIGCQPNMKSPLTQTLAPQGDFHCGVFELKYLPSEDHMGLATLDYLR